MRTTTTLAFLILGLAAAHAQDVPSPLRIDPPADASYAFVVDRRTKIFRGPGYTYEEPRRRKVVSTLRVRPRAAGAGDNVVLAVEFLRVHGYESDVDPSKEISFDRRTDDPPSGRAETLIVGSTVEVETTRDGTLVAVRGVDEAMRGNALAATAVIADLRALVAQLPDGAAVAAGTWRTEALEGRALLRVRVSAEHDVSLTTPTEAAISTRGRIAAAPEGAGESFASSFRVSRGERTARYRVSRRDGLPIDGRVTTAYAVEARLSGSDMEVGVDTETIVAVRRIDAADSATASDDPPAPEPRDRTANSGLPGWLGTPRDVILRLAGEPTQTGSGLAGGRFDTFGAFGLIYEYDDDKFVRQVTATKVEGHKAFAGRVLGVALGDPLAKALELWGEETSHADREGAFRALEWVFDTLVIEVEAWTVTGTHEVLGDHEAETVKRIRVTSRKQR